ncbi:hypothetical protein A4A49_16375 [Nicotiana attenuata]|uniref:Uncharacterized protein n=1 Tax=Nicotiana attenuata TaxID=49451 RepID=A0A314KY82_NICAT|nr:hypothetical protein A4A49_16375 [Nicotiana attenuata]
MVSEPFDSWTEMTTLEDDIDDTEYQEIHQDIDDIRKSMVELACKHEKLLNEVKQMMVSLFPKIKLPISEEILAKSTESVPSSGHESNVDNLKKNNLGFDPVDLGEDNEGKTENIKPFLSVMNNTKDTQIIRGFLGPYSLSGNTLMNLDAKLQYSSHDWYIFDEILQSDLFDRCKNNFIAEGYVHDLAEDIENEIDVFAHKHALHRNQEMN